MNAAIAERYAAVLLTAGVDLKAGQHLYISAPLEAKTLVRALTKKAYEMGAPFVKPLYYDIEQDALRAKYAPEESLSLAPEWEQDYMEGFSKENCCYLKLAVVHHMQDVPAEKLTALARSNMGLMAGYRKNMDAWRISWTSVIYPTREWAALAYPELEEEAAYESLMQDFIRINYLDTPDPAARWAAFRDELFSICTRLDALDIAALHFLSPTADLEVELVEGGKWVGGAVSTADGTNRFMGNIPTAEVFHVPHKYGVNGRVKTTLPLNYNGSIIEDMELIFEKGRVSAFRAAKGEDVLRGILSADEGAMHLGEVALVPASSPISRTRRVFNTTLYDENAACHLAFGNYCSLVTGSAANMSEEEREERGINLSRLHVDFMIGSNRLTVTARTRDGRQVTLMRSGEWTREF